MKQEIPRLLVIAGSDSSGGAGIQADLKTAQAFGVYAQTAITAITIQDTNKVYSVNPVASEIVRGQIVAALNDIGVDAIKIGMLGNGGIATAVADALEGSSIPLVLDTVLLSSSGTPLLDDAGIAVLKSRLMRRSCLVTPNLPEAEVLTGIYPNSEDRLRNAAMVFKTHGADHVLFKGGHAFDPHSHADATNPSLAQEPATATSPTSASRAGEGEGDMVRDVLWSDGAFIPFEAPRQQTRHTHGTGCTLATAIACGLAQNLSLKDAVARAQAYVQEAIRTAPCLGQGNGPVNQSCR